MEGLVKEKRNERQTKNLRKEETAKIYDKTPSVKTKFREPTMIEKKIHIQSEKGIKSKPTVIDQIKRIEQM